MLVLDFLGWVAEKTTILHSRKFLNNECSRFEDGDLFRAFLSLWTDWDTIFPLLVHTTNTRGTFLHLVGEGAEAGPLPSGRS